MVKMLVCMVNTACMLYGIGRWAMGIGCMVYYHRCMMFCNGGMGCCSVCMGINSGCMGKNSGCMGCGGCCGCIRVLWVGVRGCMGYGWLCGGVGLWWCCAVAVVLGLAQLAPHGARWVAGVWCGMCECVSDCSGYPLPLFGAKIAAESTTPPLSGWC